MALALKLSMALQLSLATRPLEDLQSSLELAQLAEAGLGLEDSHHIHRARPALHAASNSSRSNRSNGSGRAEGRPQPAPAALAEAASASMGAAEYELSVERQSQSKVMLIFVVFLGLGFCGVDHCLVGNFILGTLKLLTVGGFGFWFLLDWMLIVFNCVNQYSTLRGFGWDVVFTACSIEDACRIGQVTCLLHAPFVFTLVKAKLSGRSVQSSVQQPAASTVAFLRQKGLVSESPAQWEVDHVFEALDKNRDGLVTAEELKAGLTALGCSISDEQVADLIASAASPEQSGINRSQLAELLSGSPEVLARRASRQLGAGTGGAEPEAAATAAKDDATKADGGS